MKNNFQKIALIIILILFILFICLKSYKINNESFTNMGRSNISNDTFYDFLNFNENINIIDTRTSIPYNNHNLTGHIGTNIYYKIYCKMNQKKYILLRYADFKNEIKRHSIANINSYLKYLQGNFFKRGNNYILDFTGYHGFIDNKVSLWLDIKQKFGRNKANYVMYNTFLIPNDYNIFIKNFNSNNKYVLKNSFGGARSALKITNSLKEIQNYYSINKKNNFDPSLCKDAVCHSKVKYNIVQEFMEPGLLINNKKVGFRLYLVIFSNNSDISTYIYKNGICYYSQNDYNKSNNVDNNVVGSIFKMKEYIESNKLPLFFKDFIIFIKKNYNIPQSKIDFFINELKKKCKIIINSVKDKIIYFKGSNIQKFAIYGLDVEYDKDFNPYIFEGNFYFARFKSNTIYGNLIKSLYNDIFYKLKLCDKNINGFYKVD
jgi:hypothetical protein